LLCPISSKRGENGKSLFPLLLSVKYQVKKKKALRKNITKAFLIEEKKLAKKVLMLSKKK
jgi:hypothetical protein